MRLARRSAHAVVAVVAALSVGCTTGITHRVSRGENLYRIGKAYDISYQELAKANRIAPPYLIKAGQGIFIPGAKKQLPVRILTPRAVEPVRAMRTRSVGAKPVRRPVAAATHVVKSPSGGFTWPLRGKVTDLFGPRNEGHHDGVDIAAAKGTPIGAAGAGKVIFSDKLSGYGNVIIVEHGASFTTVYAHNSRNLVSKGDRVAKGSKIAEVGATGRASAPHLHFEVRKQNVATDPLRHLPRS